MAAFTERKLGTTGLTVGPIGLGSSYGLSGTDVERAFDRGVRFFLWGSLRKRDFARGVARINKQHRERAVVAIQSYSRVAFLMNWSVERALKALGTDYVDILGLAWWNGPPPKRILDRALLLKERGKVKHIMVSSHNRPAVPQMAGDFEALMIRYNAAHPGAEKDIFPRLEKRRPGVIAFTATRWGTLLQPALLPEGAPAPRASDCYRFSLSNENVDVCLAGPRDGKELDEALTAVERGPLDEEEMAWMRRVGAHVRAATAKHARGRIMGLFDRASAK